MENKFLGKVRLDVLSMGDFRERHGLFGVFGLLSDLDVDARVVFEQYKAREEVEQVFDYLTNDLEADRTCLGDDDAVRGYFMVVFLAMRLYFKILKRLREKELVGVVSVWEVLLLLSKMRMIVETGGMSICVLYRRKLSRFWKFFQIL